MSNVSPLARHVDGNHTRLCPHWPNCLTITQGGEGGQQAHIDTVHKGAMPFRAVDQEAQ